MFKVESLFMVLTKRKLVAGAAAVAILAVGGIAFAAISGGGAHKSETAGTQGPGPGGPGANNEFKPGEGRPKT